MTDRRTAIEADQIQDHTLTPLEIYTVNEPLVDQILSYDENGQFYWSYIENLQDFFEIDGNDILPKVANNIFTYDGNDDLMPTLDGTYDEEFEINSNDEITPKE
jgi:hypothetical protein